MSTVLSGAAADLGQQVRLGVEAEFDRVNREGGIHGRRLRLMVLDDGYEPSRAVPNMHELIEKQGVLAVIGNFGTPTAIAAMPIAVADHTLFFAAYSGYDGLRTSPPCRYVINFRASYAEEATAMIDALVDKAGLAAQDICFLTQKDSYGDAGFRAVIAALKKHGLEDPSKVLRVQYKRNTLNVEDALADILMATHTPKAVVMVGAYAPCAKFIRLSHESGWDPIFLSVSSVGTTSLAAALGNTPAEVIVTQVVPHPDSTRLALIADFRSDLELKSHGAEPTFTSLEGYVSARILVRGLLCCAEPPTREGLIDALESLGRFDPGIDETLTLSQNEHQASHRVWPTLRRQGRFMPMDWSELGAMPTKEPSP